MGRFIDALFFGTWFVVATALLFLAPTDDITRTVAYVLLVECPAVVLLAMSVHAYLDWRVRR